MGASQVTHSLTIVLPVHNGESRLLADVHDVLELAGELTDRFRVLIVDDGSSDDTYEMASELAIEYPQVSVVRNARRRGLGRALDSIRKLVKSDFVIVHDGVTPLDANHVRRLWQQCTQPAAAERSAVGTGIRELAGISSVHEAMVRAHQHVLGFQVVQSLSANDAKMREEAASDDLPRPHSNDSFRPAGDIGRIPPLPRPNFLEAIADFALGE